MHNILDYNSKQLTETVYRYAWAELRQLPLNTVMNGHCEEVKQHSSDEPSAAAAAVADVGGDFVANDDKNDTTVQVYPFLSSFSIADV